MPTPMKKCTPSFASEQRTMFDVRYSPIQFGSFFELLRRRMPEAQGVQLIVHPRYRCLTAIYRNDSLTDAYKSSLLAVVNEFESGQRGDLETYEPEDGGFTTPAKSKAQIRQRNYRRRG